MRSKQYSHITIFTRWKRVKKTFSVFICALLVCTLLFTGLFCMGEVQVASKPSVPEFTVQYNEQFYNIPDKESIDTYTGKTVIIPGYSAINRTIDIIIKNPHSSSELYQTSSAIINSVVACFVGKSWFCLCLVVWFGMKKRQN